MTTEHREGTRALADAISRISEDRYYAGWYSDCEYDIWQALADPNYRGDWELRASEAEHLKTLSEKIDGWVEWANNPEGDGVYRRRVPMAEWLEQYAAKGYPR